jgi:hypothetical protein
VGRKSAGDSVQNIEYLPRQREHTSSDDCQLWPDFTRPIRFKDRGILLFLHEPTKLREKYSDNVQPVLSWSFAYAGPADDAEKMLEPFNKIEAISSDKGDGSYGDILVKQGTDITSASCFSGKYEGSTAMLQTYNVTTERQIYNVLKDRLAAHPEFGGNALVFYEGYSSKATQAIDAKSTAYPHRNEYLVVYVFQDPKLQYVIITNSGISTGSSMQWFLQAQRVSHADGVRKF